MNTKQLKFVRPKNGLPLTFLIVGEGKSIGGEDIWLVKEFGYSKTFGALKSATRDLELSPLMAEQVAHWLSMINFKPAGFVTEGGDTVRHECMFHTRYWTTSQGNVTVDWRECSHCRIRYRKFFPDGKWHLAPIQPA